MNTRTSKAKPVARRNAGESAVSRTTKSDKGSVQSAEVGLNLLVTLAENGGDLTLSALSAQSQMAPAKAHRYLVSLIRAGFVEQDPRSERYALGPQAIRVGLVALGRLDMMEEATNALYRLRDRIDETVLLAVWGAYGATVVRRVDASRPVTVNARIGSVLPLLRSATGLVFGAFLPKEMIEPVLASELALAREGAPLALATTEQAAHRLFDTVRQRGIGFVDGARLVGIQSFSAPVFNAEGELACALTTLGPTGSFDDRPDGQTALAVLDVARDLSVRLGSFKA
ncbi:MULTISPECIES: IclR family transcriptional regulator [unclassified Beijerinckia]|uniref:IclR family transcriptional regulator n=1 Tax=unclassified Beijerinckia TaxID=2638183 RepID=UPI000894C3FF|nr:MULTISPECIES: IclR family transcriptional regulator [unclassified Beijerinckia]MDH7794689.1 DNA-binding IclR family transcriptional regulator [Beijerinckia sp. GAS462]SEB71325.1 transcriptional regulator, IclR family [Beijerinckia sp. 28-YEA-48]